MVQIKFIKFGANSAFGGFAPGDRMRTSEAMARHLVEEVACAVYVDAPAPVQEAVEPAEEKPAKGKKGAK